MIKFFRTIRQKLLSGNKFSKYLVYAVGEIVLVVIGILLALQINTWNNQVQTRKQEKEYLNDIKTNLLSDRKEAEGCINYNNNRITVIDTVLRLLNQAETNHDYMNYVINNQRVLSTFPTFDPVSTAFDNMTASHSINIIKNTELRTLLSEYYSYDWEKSPQSVSRSRTRKFADILTNKMVSEPAYHKNFEAVYKPMLPNGHNFKWIDDFALDFKDPDYFEFHKDRKAISSMIAMVPTSIYQNAYIGGAIGNIDTLLAMIDKEISNR